ncbi:two-component sensor histidine kinase, partial [Pseudomonas syringae pv. tagetis]
VTQLGEAQAAYPGKPLALRRCIGNLFDNALKYVHRAHLKVEDNAAAFVLLVDDEWPGGPQQRLEHELQPHIRQAANQKQD